MTRRTGKVLWTFNALTGVLPGSITYELDGKQYIGQRGRQPGGPNADYSPQSSRCWCSRWAARPRCRRSSRTPFRLNPRRRQRCRTIAHGGELYGKYCSPAMANGQARAACSPT
jgi:hypothetical protein